jgi:predicted histidine transporter YuiF (NhaC family)
MGPLPHLNWAAVTLAVGLVICLAIVWKLNRDESNQYFVRDLLLDTVTNRASLDKHILLFFACLAAWYIMVRTLDGKEVEGALLGVLGIFVVQRGAGMVANAYATRKDPP